MRIFRRDMLLYNREGQDPADVAGAARGAEQAQSGVPRAAAAGRGGRTARTVKRLLGFVPSWIETFSARSEKMRPLLAGDFLERFRPARRLPRLLQRYRCPRPARRARAAAPVALSVVEDRVARLHPDHARRPHGDGAFDRGPGAVPRPPCRRGDPIAAGIPEDPRHDGEVRASRGGPRRHHRHRLPPAEASVPEPAGDAQSRHSD